MAFYFTSMLLFGTSTFGDALRGYEIIEQMEKGGGFNQLVYPSISNSQYSYFVSWWSPAQWIFPYVISILFKTNSIQVIQFILIFTCLIISLIGYYKLFKKFGFTENSSLLSLLCIVTNQLFYWQTFLYFGGDLFLLAFTPFYCLAILKYSDNRSVRSLLVLLGLTSVGIFLKNSVYVFTVASVVFLFLSIQNKTVIERVKLNVSYWILLFVLIGISILFFLSKGDTPSNSTFLDGYGTMTNDFLGDLTYSIGSPIGIFSHFTFYAVKLYEYFFSNRTLINSFQLIPFLATFYFYFKFPRNEMSNYFKFLLYFAAVFLLIFTLFHFLNKSVSYEMRHFAPVAFLFFPGIIYWILKSKYRNIGLVFLFLVGLLEARTFTLSILEIEKTHSFWHTLKLKKEDVELTSQIEQWDRKTGNGLVVIENYWQLVLGARKNGKLVIERKNHHFYVVSGMEYEKGDEIQLTSLFLNRYSSILFISKEIKPEDIKVIREKYKVKKTKTMNGFSYIELTENK